MEKTEIKSLLSEVMFTNICKHGFIKHKSTISGTYDIRFTNVDIKKLSTGEILEKNADDAILKFMLQDIDTETIKEIIKRSPIYSDLSQEI